VRSLADVETNNPELDTTDKRGGKMQKEQNLFKIVRGGILGASLTLLMLAMPVAAQNNNTGTTGTTTTTTRTDARDDRRRDDEDKDRDWGWLGLLGLAGLLGLMPRKRVPVVHEARDVHPNTADRR
jgi:hypothetical protein